MMKLTTTPLLILIGALGCATAGAQEAPEATATAKASRPNFILMLTDDQGWGDVGYNGHPHIKTPNLDEMSVTGVRFDRFYAAAATCAPTRAGVMTGRHNFRVGVVNPSVKDWHLQQNEWTLAEMLQEQGYATAHYGKWHLGTLYTDRESEHNLFPNEAGFDEYMTSENILYTYDPYQGLPMKKPEDHMYVENGRFISLAEGQAMPEMRRDDATILADKTIDFMTRKTEEGKPFFVALWFHHVHTPLGQNPELMKMYPDVPEKEATYYSNVTAVDVEVGRIRAKLKELGVADDTILLFFSDNGPISGTKNMDALNKATVNGNTFRYNHGGSAGPYRSGKRRLYEGGIRVPAVMEWPAKIPQPMQTSFACNGLDLFATMADILDVNLPEDRIYDGISLLPMFEGKMEKRNKPMPFISAQQRGWMDGQYKIMTSVKGQVLDQLYDVVNDPFETKNLIDEKPEVYQRLVKDYLAWEEVAAAEGRSIPNTIGKNWKHSQGK